MLVNESKKMKIFLILLTIIVLVGFLVLLISSPSDNNIPRPLENKPKDTLVIPEKTIVASGKKEFYFTDEKGNKLFADKKLILTPGPVEIHKDLMFQVVSDDNGRWKLELESKEYFLDEALNNFEEGALYPISDESLKNSNPLILSKTQK